MSLTTEFVRGFASRACQIDPSMQEIVLTSGNGPLLDRIAVFLRKQRIKCTVGPIGDRYRLRVRGFDALCAWRDKIGFIDADRKQKLDSIITGLEPKVNGG